MASGVPARKTRSCTPLEESAFVGQEHADFVRQTKTKKKEVECLLRTLQEAQRDAQEIGAVYHHWSAEGYKCLFEPPKRHW